jgi:hypothetical protein
LLPTQQVLLGSMLRAELERTIISADFSARTGIASAPMVMALHPSVPFPNSLPM